MSREMRRSDSMALGKQTDIDTVAGSYGIEEYMDVMSAEYKIGKNTQQRFSADATYKPSQNVDYISNPSGKLIFRMVDHRVFEPLLGDLTDSDPNANIVPQEELDYWSLKIALESAKHALIKGAKLGDFSINLEGKEEALKIEADFIGKHFDVISSAVSPTTPSQNPLEGWMCSVDYDGSALGIVNRMNVNVSRNMEAARGMESMSGGEELMVSEIVEKKLGIEGTIEIEVESTDHLEDVLGGTGITTSRSDVDIVIHVDDTGNRDFDITLSGCRYVDYDDGINEESEIRIVTLSFFAKDIEVDGTYKAAP